MSESASRTNDRYLRPAEVYEITGYSPAAVRRWTQTGQFPPPQQVDGRRVWLESTVEAWLAGYNLAKERLT